MTLLPALTLGVVLGVRHATDADHIAAIGTIVADGRSARRAALVGAAWGIGHSLSVLLVGGALVLLRLPMPARLALGFEFAVAIMLVGLGVRSLRAGAPSPASSVRPMLVGVMHGLAGSAVLALLVLGTTNTMLGAVGYLAAFAIGTVAGMATVTALLTLPARMRPARAVGYERAMRVAAGVASVAIGLFMAHRVGVRDGLFAAATSWTP
jgi:high-affinity nickel-transport protein